MTSAGQMERDLLQEKIILTQLLIFDLTPIIILSLLINALLFYLYNQM
jgi:hypothetical protein